MPETDTRIGWLARAQRYLFAGILTVIPIWITVLVFKFILGQLSSVGRPWVRTLAEIARPYSPDISQFLLESWLQSAAAVIITVVGLYLLGWAATRVIGKRLLNLFDRLMHRIPFVQTIYGGTQKLIAALGSRPDRVERVVLIEFPSPEMKAVGLVTHTLLDEATGRELAVVYVPTTPNPTSGYVEIVPVERLVSTGWTMDQAMSFIISGGAVAPSKVHYQRRASPVVPGTESRTTGAGT
jgi:uncharacterized membrane protein